MDLDEIISPEMREAVRRTLAMNDALSTVGAELARHRLSFELFL